MLLITIKILIICCVCTYLFVDMYTTVYLKGAVICAYTISCVYYHDLQMYTAFFVHARNSKVTYNISCHSVIILPNQELYVYYIIHNIYLLMYFNNM